MESHGTILDNLEHAIGSARRLRGYPVYKDILTYWGELLQEARRIRMSPACDHRGTLDALIVKLESELAERAAWRPLPATT
jgi:hypothetical protein